MRDEPSQDPLPGIFLGGVTVSEAMAMRAEAQARAEDDGLRLDTDRFEEELRRLQPPSRTAIITLWAVGLAAALGIAAYIQVSRQTTAAVIDASPPPTEVAAAAPQAAVREKPILPAPAPIAPAAPPTTLAAKSPPPAPTLPTTSAPTTDITTAHTEPTRPPEDIGRLRGHINRAYAQAVKAGVPPEVLKARRAEWTVLYAKAKRTSPAAVAALYKTRAAQLEALAKRQHAAGRSRG